MKRKALILLITLLFQIYLSGAALKKEIYLTFDDGPSAVTKEILKILSNENVTATFFVVGVNVQRYPNLIKEIYESGHSIGIHSYSHKYKEIYTSAETLIEDINKCKAVIIKSVPDYASTLYRFPGGSFGLSEKLLEAVKAAGYHYVDWNAATRDAEIENANSKTLFREAIETGADRKRIVMLMHDSANKKATVEALKMIIEYYKGKNYAFRKL